jgi:hypothetical protein
MELLIYILLLLAVIGGLGFWIFKARSAMKSAGQHRINNDQNFPPPSAMR